MLSPSGFRFIGSEDGGRIYLRKVDNIATTIWCNNPRAELTSTIKHNESPNSVKKLLYQVTYFNVVFAKEMLLLI
jgi:hypothetical protein